MTKITLSVPVELDGTTFTELNLRRINLGDIETVVASTDEMSGLVALIARLANVPIEVVRLMDLVDTVGAMDAVATLLAGMSVKPALPKAKRTKR